MRLTFTPLIRAFAAAGLLHSVPGLAQDGEATGAAPAPDVQRVEVTGSSIKRIVTEGALPVQIFNEDYISRSGAQSVSQLLQALPAIQGFTASASTVGSSSGGFSSASIHGIGESRTLVLLDGHRVATWAGQSLTGSGAGIDLNSIPLAAVERIEVLTDGASALYGSDAIAGVVNFILKKNSTAGVAQVSLTQPTRRGGAVRSVSLTKGVGDLDLDGYNLLLSYGHDDQRALAAKNRSFSRSNTIPFTSEGQSLAFVSGSQYTVPATVQAADGSWHNPYYDANGACLPGNTAADSTCYFDYSGDINIIPAQKRDNVLASFVRNLDATTQVNASVVYSDTRLTSTLSAPAVDFLLTPASPYYAATNAAYGAPGGTSPILTFWRATDAGQRQETYRTKALNASVGVKGSIGDWDYEASFTHSQNTWTQSYGGGYMTIDGVARFVDDGSVDPFALAGQQSAAAMAEIDAAKVSGKVRAGLSKLDFVEVHGSNPLFTLPGGDAALGYGLDARHESDSFSPSALAQATQSGGIVGDSPDVPFGVSRTALGAFAELNLPLRKSLEFTPAVRYDHYSDFGSAFTGKTSFRFTPVPELLFRGSVGTGFRAPSAAQTVDVRQSSGVTGGSYDCPFASTDPLAAACQSQTAQYNLFAAGNPDLRPEKSLQASLGFRFEPDKHATIGIDAWNVSLRDTLGSLSESAIFADPEKYRSLFFVYGTPSPTLGVLRKNLNLGDSRTSGLDLDARLRFDTPIGALQTQLLGTWTLRHQYQLERDGAWHSDLGRYNDGAVTLRFQGQVVTTLKQGAFDHTLTWHYKSGYADAQAGLVYQRLADGSIGAPLPDFDRLSVRHYATVDWQTRYSVTRNLDVVAGLINVFGTKPPLTLKQDAGVQVGFDERYADPRGRTVIADLTWRF